MEFDESNPLDWLKVGALVILGLGLLTGLAIGVKTVLFPTQIVNKVIDAKKAVSGYEWYEAQYAEINATVSKINGFYKIHPTLDNAVDKVTLDGMVQYLEGICGDYNGRSRMMTRNLWKAPNLPYQIKVVYGDRIIAINGGEE